MLQHPAAACGGAATVRARCDAGRGVGGGGSSVCLRCCCGTPEIGVGCGLVPSAVKDLPVD